jgi:hypothetical protein
LRDLQRRDIGELSGSFPYIAHDAARVAAIRHRQADHRRFQGSSLELCPAEFRGIAQKIANNTGITDPFTSLHYPRPGQTAVTGHDVTQAMGSS